jgi:V8-like Glu-specific endopeptidase
VKRTIVWLGLIFISAGLQGADIAMNPLTHEQTLDQWTPEMFKEARPLELTRDVEVTELLRLKIGETDAIFSEGHAPILDVKPDPNDLLFEGEVSPAPEALLKKPAASAPLFTSSRLVPQSADQAYPYRTVGKLFFKKPDGNTWVCSGSVISQRLVLTAGHCVHDGSGRIEGYYSDFVFIPAYRDGNAPLERWTWASGIVTNAWWSGKQKLPNASDFAILEMNDGGAGQRIGLVTGWLGWITNRLAQNHVLSLGYPQNIDNGERMHQAASQSIGSTGNGTVAYGTDMEGGSSGGPWVQNFGEAGAGQARLFNYTVGVTSFGSPGLNKASSSNMDSQFTAIWSVMCEHRLGNCS